MNAIPVQLWLFLVKIRSSWNDLIHDACQNCPKGKRQWLNWSNLLFPDGQHRTRGSSCEMLEIRWRVLTLKQFCTEREESLSGEDLDCKVLSVMMRHLNILKHFSYGIESLWTRTVQV